MLPGMSHQPPHRTLAGEGEILPPDTGSTSIAGVPTPSREAALAAAHGFVSIAMMAG
jgi:hypothetical protein